MTKLPGSLATLTPARLRTAEIEYCRRLCRQGNPFPLIALQWPSLLITDPDEASYFQGEVGNNKNPCLRLDDWQRQIIAAFFDDGIREIAVKGCTKAGKGTAVAMANNLTFDAYEECKVIFTSQRFDHAQKVIFGEFVRWRERMRSPGPGVIQSSGVADTTNHYCVIANPGSGEGFSGQHSARTVFNFDEATSVPDGRYDDAQKQAALIIAIANPRTLSGWFRGLFKLCTDANTTQVVQGPLGGRLCMTVSGEHCMNAKHRRLERPIAPIGGYQVGDYFYHHGDRIPFEHYQQLKPLIPEQIDYARLLSIQSHADPQHRKVFGSGHFPDEDREIQVISASWLPRHYAAWRTDLPVAVFGFDPAASEEGDESALAVGGQDGCLEILTTQKGDTMQLCGWLLRTVKERYGIDLTATQHPLVLDMDGIGKSIGDRLRELHVYVIEFHGNSGSRFDSNRYGNLRAECYAEMGRRLSPIERWGDSPEAAWALPPQHEGMLTDELCAPEKVFGSDGFRFHISPKRPYYGMSDKIKTISNKLGRSPDRADAVVMLYYGCRILYMLDAWYGSPSAGQPLTISPAPVAAPTANAQPSRTPEPEAEIEVDLLKWLETRYSGGRLGDTEFDSRGIL